MARKAKEAIEEQDSSSQDTLSSFLKENKEDHFSLMEEQESKVISTGSLILDTHVKIRSGNVIRLCASGAELGKTSESFVLMDNYLKTMPKSKGLYILAERKPSPELFKRSGLKWVDKPEDWVEGTVFKFVCNTFETIADLLEKLLEDMYEKGEHLCVNLDSLDMVQLKQDKNKNLWGKDSVKVAGVPFMMKLLFKRLSLKIGFYNAMLIIISQYSAEIKLDPYSKDPPRQAPASGGSAVGHQSDYVLYYHPRYSGDYIYEKPDDKPDPVKNKTLGVYATVEVKKSGSDVTGTKVKIPIAKGRIGSAIWVEKEVVDMIIMFQLVTKQSAWFAFTPTIIEQAKEAGIELKEKHQGVNGLYKYLEEDKAAFEWFLKKIKDALL